MSRPTNDGAPTAAHRIWDRIKDALLGSPLAPALKRIRGALPIGSQQDREWASRVNRDEAAMIHIIRREMGPTSNSVDVGAHKGDILRYLLAAAPAGECFAVEPIPHLADSLRRRYPRAQIAQCALSDRDGETTFFHVPSNEGWSGLRKQDVLMGDEAVELVMPIRRLDDMVSGVKINMVKIDVEGAELGVLRGAKRLLKEDRPIFLLEHARIHARNFGTEPADLWAVFASAGYTVAPVADESAVVPDSAAFISLCDSSDASGYDRRAVTNWIARPRAQANPAHNPISA